MCLSIFNRITNIKLYEDVYVVMDTDFSLTGKQKRKTNKVPNGVKPTSITTQSVSSKTQIVYKYNLDDFHKIKQSMKIQIPPAILEKLKIVYQQMKEDKDKHYKNYVPQTNKPSYPTQHVHSFSRDDFNKQKQKQKGCELNDEDWEAMRNFKLTHKDKKEGFEKIIDTIRSLLNKLTDTNFHEFNTLLHETIKTSLVEIQLLNFFRVVEIVVVIVGNNAFYSKMYSDFLLGLFNEYKELESEFNEKYKALFSLVYNTKYNYNDIRIGNPEENYDNFCEINKENETRKNMCLFLGDVLNSDAEKTVISCCDFFDVVEQYFTLFLDYAVNDDMLDECNEACEIYSILHNKLHSFLEENDLEHEEVCEKFNAICSKIKGIQIMKKNDLRCEYPSINNKILFKLMDINLNMF